MIKKSEKILRAVIAASCLSAMSAATAVVTPSIHPTNAAPSQSKQHISTSSVNPEAEILLGIEHRICAHLFTQKDLKHCEKMIHEIKEPRLRHKYLLLLARNTRVNGNNPIACIEMLGPVLVPEEKMLAWKAARANVLKETLERSKTDCAEARAEKREEFPEKPAGITLPFPPIAEWDIRSESVECALEIVRAHMDMHEYQSALLMIDAVGKKFEGEGRVLAYECAGDLMVQMQSYEKAVKFYQFALGLLKTLASPGEGPTQKQKTIESRLLASLAEAKRLLEVEQYGEGYVLYRDAEQKRRVEGAFTEALLLYEDLCRQFPKTVYSEAATAYSIDCLLTLADDESVGRLRVAIGDREKLLKHEHDKYKAMKQNKVDQSLLDAQAALMSQEAAHLERMRKAPFGFKAAKEAKKMAEVFLAANPYGLYRGETILRLADFALEHEFKIKESLAWFERGCHWFEKIKDVDSQVDTFDVPSKAKAVSAPPPEMKYKDEWGNVEWSRLEVGKLFNQKTSAWYVPYHRMMGRTRRSLCYFIVGDRKKALEGLEIILQVDERERNIYMTGMPNSYSRLRAEFEEGRMFATQEELKNFGGIQRTALLVAEYYFELEKWNEAKIRYEHIDRTMRSHLNFQATAYLDFMLGNCALMTGNKTRALEEYRKFETIYRKTPTWPRAMFNIYNIFQFMPEKKEEALNYLRIVHRMQPDTDLGQRAYYHEGEFWYANGKWDRAKLIFLDCQKKYKGTWLARGSGQYLAKIEAAEKKQ